MAKRVQDVALSSRTARMKLLPRHKPYFRLMSDGVHLGYRRSTVTGRAGTWLVRRYESAGKYETRLIGTADDTPDKVADGLVVLTFDQAQTLARDWARKKAAVAIAEQRQIASETVRNAISTYISNRVARDAKAGKNAKSRLSHHVLSAPLADVALLDLTEGHFEHWRAGLVRGGRGQKANPAPLAPATVARLLNDIRAALAAATRRGKVSADVVTVVRDGLRAPPNPDRVRTMQVLTDADVRKLVDAAAAQDVDFGALVLLLAATGSRLNQLARVTVADFQPDARRLMVPVSRKGRGTKQITHIAVPLPDDVVERLRFVVSGRAGPEVLLLRWHHHQVSDDGEDTGGLKHWEPIERRPWSDAGEMSRPWRATVAAARLPPVLVPYCLRHSSIVRGLRAGLPVRLVAAVHDTSAEMVERHYGAFIVDASEDLLRRALVPMASRNGTVPAASVRLPLR